MPFYCRRERNNDLTGRLLQPKLQYRRPQDVDTFQRLSVWRRPETELSVLVYRENGGDLRCALAAPRFAKLLWTLVIIQSMTSFYSRARR